MIAITGAAGFIGSNLARRLQKDGADLLLIDHPLTAKKACNLLGLKKFQFVEHEQFLLDLESGCVSPDIVFHLGACSSTTETNWHYLRMNNIEYSKRVWQWCSQSQKPLVYASSAATYGDGKQGFDDTLHPCDLRPLNLYGKSKNDFDIWALAQIDTPPSWAGVKFFNVYGPYEAHKGRMASMAYQAFTQIKNSGQVRLFRSNDPAYPDGGQVRDFVYVCDCVDHLIHLSKHKRVAGLYNSGTGVARSFFDLTMAIFSALAVEPKIEYIDMPVDLANQYQNLTRANVRNLQSVIPKWNPTPLEKGLQEYVAWLTSNT